MSTIQLFDKFSQNVSTPSGAWTAKASKNKTLLTNLGSLEPLFKKLK